MFRSINGTNVEYMNGPILGSFIQDYCEEKGIYCDAWIFNMAFGTETTYSESEAIALIEETTQKWHLRDTNAQHLETRQ